MLSFSGITFVLFCFVSFSFFYSVKRTQLIGRRPLSPCRVRKTAGCTLPQLLFPRTVPRFSQMYPDLAGNWTLPSAIFSVRITFRSPQRTPKSKSSCSKQAMATGIFSKKNQNTPRPSEHPPVMGGKMSKRLGGIKGCKYKTSSCYCLLRRAVRSYQRTSKHQLFLL